MSYEYDDWFYDSIQSYKTLLMYELQIDPLRMTETSCSFYVAGHHAAKDMTEVILISMPAKLLLPEEEANLCKNNDFEIEASKLFDSEVHMIEKIAGSETAVVSFSETAGLTILDLSSDNTEQRNTSRILPPQTLSSPNITTHNSEPQLIATKNSSDDVFKINCQTLNKMTFPMPLELTKSEGEIVCSYCENNCVALLHTTTGMAALYDPRSIDYTLFNKCDINSSYVFECLNSQLALLSSEGTIKIYDTRQSDHFLIDDQLKFAKVDDNKHLKVSLASNSRIAISGFNSFVYIYDTSSSDIRQIFKHGGHNEAEDIKEAVVTDHFWLPEISPNMIASCAKNGTLNCWEYVV